MQIRIREFEQDGTKYISVDRMEGNIWIEKSFEYINSDPLKTILSLLEININKIIK